MTGDSPAVPPEAYEAAIREAAEHDGDWYEDRDFLQGDTRRTWHCRKCIYPEVTEQAPHEHSSRSSPP